MSGEATPARPDGHGTWIVFDLIGVLAEPSWRELGGAPDLGAWASLKTGLLDESDFWDEEQARHYRSLLAFRPERLRLLRGLKERGYRICVATNFHADWVEPLKRSVPSDLVSAWVVSSDIKVAKPSADFWQRVLETVPPGTVVVDDRRDNCESARRAGLRCLWAHPAAQVERDLEALLAEATA